MDEVVHLMISPNLLNIKYPLSDLKNIIYYPLITTNVESRKNLWQNWFEYHNISYTTDKLKFIKVEDSSQALMAAAAGIGMILSDKLFGQNMLNNKSLIIPAKSEMPTSTYHLVYPRENLKLKKVRYFREWLIKQFSKN
jgi:DNA-binding transcriptional LysR family regulator